MSFSPSPTTADRGPLPAVAEVRRALLHIRDREAMLTEACRIAVEVAGVRMAWVGLLDAATRSVDVAGWSGAVGTYLDEVQIEPDDPVLGAGPTGRCMRDGVMVVSEDIAADEAMAPWRERALAHGFATSAALPLRAGETTLGALCVYADRPHALGPELLRALTALADDIAVTLDRLALLEQLEQAREALSHELAGEQERTRELRRLHDERERFLSGISHELRTPLTAIHGFTETLLEHQRSLDADHRDRLLARIAANVHRLEELIDDLLDLDRFRRGTVTVTRRPERLLRLVHAVLEGLTVPDRALHVQGTEVELPVDAARIERIVDALVANAVQHTPAGTTIWVDVRPTDDGALLVVEDDGPGVPVQLREAVVQPFARGADPVARGVGIGLSLAAQSAALHGGEMRLTERPGGGARIEVTLRR